MNFFNKKNIRNEDTDNDVVHNLNESSNKKLKKNSDVIKLNDKIREEQHDIEQTQKELGKLYYQLYRNEEHEKLVPLCNVIDESYRIINLCENQVLFLQGIKVCPNCKAHISLDSVFCNKCGAKIETEESIDSEEDINNKQEDEVTYIKCRECGLDMESDTVFCTNCGAKIQ